MGKNKFQIKREATLKQLIEAGLACFLEKGFAATRIEDIVKRAGFTRGAFYFHFKTKEEVFFRILELRASLRSGWTEVPRQYRVEETTLEQVLAKCLHELESRMKDQRKWFMVLIDFYMQTKEDPEARSKLREHYRAWIVEIAEFVDVLKEGGWISKDTDSRQVAAQMWAFAEGYSATTFLFGEFDPDTLLSGFMKLLK
ncbi:TetR/AcrR family transcriptional regulator [Xylanibacillus composti]|uniref:Putative HTH-type transcriptional regulator YwcC n=1 Tax=Xylanibacillus composti TaxID=1572762 RepID=A0A8J4H7R1_9BACL|nr:TetR/AcrR family transcriptional regulator [Xylanibacillus composti]MDT9726922.1 TetR/AcrR family transcriptional regulator [Xylanibacillus composti]GIQ71382.1 putative HTH-type transcriptional regulator YwcC [Xylanibacillus composti]